MEQMAREPVSQPGRARRLRKRRTEEAATARRERLIARAQWMLRSTRASQHLN